MVPRNPTNIRRKIAISDDDPDQRGLLVTILERDGHELIDFESGIELVQAIEKGYNPDIVVTDYQMPEMCGFEVAQRLSEIVPGVDVYMVTGSSIQDRLDEAKGAGKLQGYCIKPYSPKDIKGMLNLSDNNLI